MTSNIKLTLAYTVIAGLIAALGSPIPGTSLLLTGLEVLMVVHLARKNNFDLGLQAIGFTATTIWGISTALKDTAIELLKFVPGLGWLAGVLVAVVFVFFLGLLANLYFKKEN
jgi:uncharacterized protein (DUF697 family)